jgi:hypothetical protein
MSLKPRRKKKAGEQTKINHSANAKANTDATTVAPIFHVSTIPTAPFALAPAVRVAFAAAEEVSDLVLEEVGVNVGVALGVRRLVVKVEFPPDPVGVPFGGGGTAVDGSAKAPTPQGIGSPFP